MSYRFITKFAVTVVISLYQDNIVQYTRSAKTVSTMAYYKHTASHYAF